jgi:hypothetical protein
MSQTPGPTPRPITEREAAVVKAALLNARVDHDAAELVGTIHALALPICDGVGRTLDGRTVCVMVFAGESELTCLEVLDMYGGTPARLPDRATVRPWSDLSSDPSA